MPGHGVMAPQQLDQLEYVGIIGFWKKTWEIIMEDLGGKKVDVVTVVTIELSGWVRVLPTTPSSLRLTFAHLLNLDRRLSDQAIIDAKIGETNCWIWHV